MNYRSCAALNKSFIVTDEGAVACPASQTIVRDSLQRAYIFTSLFFYDITEREMNKLLARVAQKRETLLASTGIAEDAVEQIYPNLVTQFRTELGDNSFDPLIKIELSKSKKSLVLQLTPAEQEQIAQMREAICANEILKFKNAVIFTQPNGGLPYQVNFSQKYIEKLPPRCKRFLKPTIKMLAYMDGRQFRDFELNDDYQLSYKWALEQPQFDEEKIKNDLKSMIAGENNSVL